MNCRVLLTFCLLTSATASWAQSRTRFTSGRPVASQHNYSQSRATYSRYIPGSRPSTPTIPPAPSTYSSGNTDTGSYQPARYAPPSYSSGRGFRPLQKPSFTSARLRSAAPSSASIPQTTEEQPVPRAGALIRTEGMATQYGASAPSLLHTIESGGGFISMEAGRGQLLNTIGVHTGRADRNTQSGQASGRNSITTIE